MSGRYGAEDARTALLRDALLSGAGPFTALEAAASVHMSRDDEFGTQSLKEGPTVVCIGCGVSEPGGDTLDQLTEDGWQGVHEREPVCPLCSAVERDGTDGELEEAHPGEDDEHGVETVRVAGGVL